MHVTVFHSEMISVQKNGQGLEPSECQRCAESCNLSKSSVATKWFFLLLRMRYRSTDSRFVFTLAEEEMEEEDEVEENVRVSACVGGRDW